MSKLKTIDLSKYGGMTTAEMETKGIPKELQIGHKLAIPLEDLDEDEKFQRPVNAAHIKNLVTNWDQKLCTELWVASYEGQLKVIDGRSRKLAMQQKKMTHAWCLVVEGLTEREIYNAFYVMNKNRLSMSEVDLFRFGYKAGHTTPCAAWDIMVEELEFTIPLHRSDPYLPHECKAHKALIRIINEHGGPKTLRKVGQIIKKTFCDDAFVGSGPGALKVRSPKYLGLGYDFMVGMAHFVNSGTRFTVEEAHRRFRAQGDLMLPAEVRAEAISRAKIVGDNGIKYRCRKIGEVLLEAFEGYKKPGEWRKNAGDLPKKKKK